MDGQAAVAFIVSLKRTMGVGVTNRLWEVADIVRVLEDWEEDSDFRPKFGAGISPNAGGQDGS
jgi:hypothetical protein